MGIYLDKNHKNLLTNPLIIFFRETQEKTPVNRPTLGDK